MNTLQGDLIDLAQNGKFDVIAHGCNCFCAMGAGIALSIRIAFPEAYEADCRTVKGDQTKLGTCSFAVCTRGGHEFTVVNAYTQYHWKGEGVLADYDAIRSCMRWLKERHAGKRIGLPKIGAGLARGDWKTISAIIQKELDGENVCIVLCEE